MPKARRVLILAICFVIGLALDAFAKPTIAGTLINYNPGAGRLQIRREDGTVKSVVMVPGAVYELYGQQVSGGNFRAGMKVMVRICGSLGDNPLQGDLMTDYGSSNRYVARTAHSSNNTPVGSIASVGGASGPMGSAPAAITPSIIGPVGLGGNFPGSLTNPGANGPVNNSAFPAMPATTNPVSGAQPSPAGSPFTGQVIAGQTNPNGTPVNPAGGNPYAQQNLYAQQTNPYAQSISGVQDMSSSGMPSMSSMINGSDDEDDEDGGSFMPSSSGGGGPLGMQVVQVQGRVMAVDPRNRSITVVPANAVQPVQVSLPANLYPADQAGRPIPLEQVRSGYGIIIQGLANAAGIIEARRIQITP